MWLCDGSLIARTSWGRGSFERADRWGRAPSHPTLHQLILQKSHLVLDVLMRDKVSLYLFASSEESVGKNWFRKCAEVVIDCSFIGFLGAKTV